MMTKRDKIILELKSRSRAWGKWANQDNAKHSFVAENLEKYDFQVIRECLKHFSFTSKNYPELYLLDQECRRNSPEFNKGAKELKSTVDCYKCKDLGVSIWKRKTALYGEFRPEIAIRCDCKQGKEKSRQIPMLDQKIKDAYINPDDELRASEARWRLNPLKDEVSHLQNDKENTSLPKKMKTIEYDF